MGEAKDELVAEVPIRPWGVRALATASGTAERIERDGQIRLWWEGTPVYLFFNYAPVHDEAALNRRTVPFEGTKIPVLGPVEPA